MSEAKLWRFFHEVQRAVVEGNEGRGPQPYQRGTFLVSALAGDVELTIQDVSEEDAILIAGELRELGARALVRGSLRCSSCGRRVPAQERCVRCRAPLPSTGETWDPDEEEPG